MSDEPLIYHLLKPKEFRVWCVPNRPPGVAMNVTRFPSKATCVNCLTNYRFDKNGGKKGTFRKAWTANAKFHERTPELED